MRAGPAAAAIADLKAQADGSLNVLQGTVVEYSKDGTVALVSIPTEGSGNDKQSTAALDEIRDEIVPATIGTSTARSSTSAAWLPSRRTSAIW